MKDVDLLVGSVDSHVAAETLEIVYFGVMST